jgi:hypothetical protein
MARAYTDLKNKKTDLLESRYEGRGVLRLAASGLAAASHAYAS